MLALVEGHKYTLNCLDTDSKESLQFVDRGHGRDTGGTTNQEVLRVLIDRMKLLDKECPWELNSKIFHHLRAALLLHEMRHMERLQEKCIFSIEDAPLGKDGHFKCTL